MGDDDDNISPGLTPQLSFYLSGLEGDFAAVAGGLPATRHRAQASGATTSPSWSYTATPPLRHGYKHL
eukprot:COSAG01_NODE_48595_length_379_cov_2.917857_2_plen_67_part_01